MEMRVSVAVTMMKVFVFIDINCLGLVVSIFIVVTFVGKNLML